MSPNQHRGPGLVLLVAGVSVALSLWWSGRLEWYIHPRSVWFTGGMAALAGIAWIAGCALRVRTRASSVAASGGHNERVERGPMRPPRWRGRAAGLLALSVASLAVLLPPATLSPGGQGNGDGGGLGPGLSAPVGNSGPSADTGVEPTFRQWAALVRGPDPAELTGRGTELLGFITPDPEDPEALFVVTRYAITCCAVDAQQVGVPVYRPGWRSEFGPGEWIRVTGVFAPNPSVTSSWAAVLLPASVLATAEPENPYVTE